MPRKGFNADERATEREAGPVVIGGITYHPTRLTNKRIREVRRLSRQARLDAETTAKETPEYKEALDAAKRRGLPKAEAEAEALDAGQMSDAVEEVNTRSLMEQWPILLVDDAMQPITPEAVKGHLDEDLDARDVGDLMAYLLGGDEDPTEPAP